MGATLNDNLTSSIASRPPAASPWTATEDSAISCGQYMYTLAQELQLCVREQYTTPLQQPTTVHPNSPQEEIIRARGIIPYQEQSPGQITSFTQERTSTTNARAVRHSTPTDNSRSQQPTRRNLPRSGNNPLPAQASTTKTTRSLR